MFRRDNNGGRLGAVLNWTEELKASGTATDRLASLSLRTKGEAQPATGVQACFRMRTQLPPRMLAMSPFE